MDKAKEVTLHGKRDFRAGNAESKLWRGHGCPQPAIQAGQTSRGKCKRTAPSAAFRLSERATAKAQVTLLPGPETARKTARVGLTRLMSTTSVRGSDSSELRAPDALPSSPIPFVDLGAHVTDQQTFIPRPTPSMARVRLIGSLRAVATVTPEELPWSRLQ